jgi:hypothetical protein
MPENILHTLNSVQTILGVLPFFLPEEEHAEQKLYSI